MELEVGGSLAFPGCQASSRSRERLYQGHNTARGGIGYPKFPSSVGAHSCTHMYACIHTDTQKHTYTFMRIPHTYMHAHTEAYTHIHGCTHADTHIHTHEYTQTYRHTYMCAHIHTCTLPNINIL